MSFKLDLHVHTISHGRIFIKADQLKEALKRNNLNGVAITNFFNVIHALELQKALSEYIIIVGQEIWAKDGHVLALGIHERIDNFLDTEETIELIHKQGGIAVAPHPYLNLGLGKKVEDIPVDAIEVYNGLIGSAFFYNYLAKKTAQKMNIPQVASTDTTNSHFIGRSYTEVLTDDKDSILEALRLGKVNLHKKALPIPFGFVIRNLFKCRDVEPCSIHAVPCFVCGKSITLRLLKEKFQCYNCGNVRWSRVACCNGHHICLDCAMKKGSTNSDVLEGVHGHEPHLHKEQNSFYISL